MMSGSEVSNVGEGSATNEDGSQLQAGHTCDGESEKGNNFLKKLEFKSNFNYSGVASTCEPQQSRVEEDKMLNVINSTLGNGDQLDQLNGSRTSHNSGHGHRTILLVGRTGNGKSATGNSILGKDAFRSMHCSTGVTITCEHHFTQLEDAKMLNVVDTPGLFNISSEPTDAFNELVKCFNLAENGFHALLLVLSVQTQFSREEQAAVQSFLLLFGNKICDYMIVVFTGGDCLEESDETLEDYLSSCPEPLKETLEMCGNRKVLFDNKTVDPWKKAEQLRKLMNLVVEMNGGRPYTKDMFKKVRVGSQPLEYVNANAAQKKGWFWMRWL